jgi:hypothetical protein
MMTLFERQLMVLDIFCLGFLLGDQNVHHDPDERREDSDGGTPPVRELHTAHRPKRREVLPHVRAKVAGVRLRS